MIQRLRILIDAVTGALAATALIVFTFAALSWTAEQGYLKLAVAGIFTIIFLIRYLGRP